MLSALCLSKWIVKLSNDKWYRCDDERVTEIRFSEIKHSTRNASMLIFRNMAWEKQ